MFPSKTTSFRKKGTCPLSSELLAFQRAECGVREREKITVHLRFCEFCAAEVDLYSHYPQAEDIPDSPEIPRPLYELAQALLSHRHQDDSVLEEMLLES